MLEVRNMKNSASDLPRKLLTLSEAHALEKATADHLYRRHINPSLFAVYKILGLSDLDVASAEGVEIVHRDGRRILDFTSSIGVLSLGHNHPRIIAAEKFCHEHKVIDAIKVAPSKLQAALSFNLSVLLPPPLEVSFFSVSGAEAVEAALKLAQRVQGPARRMFITTTGAYHGKTHAALSITRCDNFGEGFLFGIPEENILEIPYGDIGALENAIRGRTRSGGTNDVAAVIVEPIQGQSVRVPPEGYISKVVAVCKENQIVSIVDEVKVGMGRTGYFCAFMAEDAVPDIVTISKCLGGGKRAIGAMVTSQEMFRRAYGKTKDASTHTTTFGGLGESCAVAIEALNIIGQPEFLADVRAKGDYLRTGLEWVRGRHPGAIRGITGRGLFYGVDFEFGALLGALKHLPRIPFIQRPAETVLMGTMVREFYRRYGILTHFSGSDPTILHVMPPLIVERHQLDRFITALDELLERGLLTLAARFVGDTAVEVIR
jgi:acetylornithine/succinyldiaminopimelate/putrescine aminotransferase